MPDLTDDWINAIATGDTAAAGLLEQQLEDQDAADAARRNRPEALLAAALWYAANGIAVFPLEPRGKKPLPGSRGFKDASTDEETIRAWWAATPSANIGAPTGITFDVIDIDGPQGVITMISGPQPTMYQQLPPLLGKVLTPRPGGQHLYVPPTGRGNAAAIFPGVDYRGAGGYVVVPPSRTSQGDYWWVQPITTIPAGARP